MDEAGTTVLGVGWSRPGLERVKVIVELLELAVVLVDPVEVLVEVLVVVVVARAASWAAVGTVG